jgi:hypothetical protein
VSQKTGPITQQAIRDELARLLLSHEFKSSRRCQELLTYIVGHALDGSADHLKERIIGIEVFGRPTSYDPSEDATVRVKAGEVRRRLGSYYANAGRMSSIRIELPSGTYVPEFHLNDNGEGSVQAVRHGRDLRTRFLWGGAALLLVLLLGAAAWFVPGRRVESAMDQFWAPVVTGDNPIAICAAYVPAYALNGEVPAGHQVTPADFTHLSDQFVGGGDLLAVSRISALLARKQRSFNVKLGDAVSFEDLRTSPAILIGYSYTRWKEISQELRYFIDMSKKPPGITDSGAVTPWVLPNLPLDRRTDEDYAIVTRVFHPATHTMMVEVAGMTQYGTDAASEFVTNADLLNDAMQHAAPGWRSKNLQIVLHVKVIAGTPATPKVKAIHVW